MNHLRLLAALLLATFSSALADSPQTIRKDYYKQAAQAVEHLNQTLEKATTPLIAALVKAGDTAGTELLNTQLKAKLAGNPVLIPHASATLLFAQYDQARAKALEPVKKASIARIESLLRAAGGASLDTVTELGKVREEIDGGIVLVAHDTMPMAWDYFTGPARRTKQADWVFKPNGTVSLVSSDKARTNLGKWTFTTDPNVLKVTLNEGSAEEEKCEFKIIGNDAELHRPVGVRYLRVTP